MSSDKCSTRDASLIVESSQPKNRLDRMEAVCSGDGFVHGSCCDDS